MSPVTPASRCKDHAEEARGTTLILKDDVDAAMRDILYFARQRMLKLCETVTDRGRELESVIRGEAR